MSDDTADLCERIADLREALRNLREQYEEEKRKNAVLQRNEEHRQRLIAGLEVTAAKMHPDYGPCDGFDGGACSVCGSWKSRSETAEREWEKDKQALADLRTAVQTYAASMERGIGRTHSEDCYQWHPLCALLLAAGE